MHLGQVVEAARSLGVEDPVAAPVVGDLKPPLHNVDVGRAVHAHRAEMHDVNIKSALDDCRQQIVRSVEIVAYCVTLVPRTFHRVWRGSLLGKMDNRIGLIAEQEIQETDVVLRDIKIYKGDGTAAGLFPSVNSRPQRLVWGDNDNVMTSRGQVQRGRPSAKSVAAEDYDLHKRSRCCPAAAKVTTTNNINSTRVATSGGILHQDSNRA